MGNVKWHIWVGIGFLFVVLTFGIGKVISMFEEDVAHSEAISVEVESKQINRLIQLEIETKKTGSFTSVKSIPRTQIESIDVPIQEWANDQEQTFFNEMEQMELLLDENIAAHFSLQSKFTEITNDIYSILIISEQSVEKENEFETKTPFVIQLNEEKILTLKEILNETLTINDIYQLMVHHTNIDLDEDSFKNNFTNINDLHWSINNEYITFHFMPKELTNEQFDIEIPLTHFHSYLNKTYYKEFISEEITEKIRKIEQEQKIAEEKKEKEKQEGLKDKKLVALTFDDGPHPTETEKILKILQDHNAKATFFVLSNNVKQYPNIAKEIVKQGHEIANHSITHANLKAVKKERVKEEINKSAITIQEITGVKPIFFRPPYGNYDDSVEKLINDSRQSIALWSVDPKDWKYKDANSIYSNVQQHTVPGSIILMHDIYPTTSDALSKILTYFEQEGYECVTMSELAPYINESKNTYFGN